MAQHWDADVELTSIAVRHLIEAQHPALAPVEVRLVGRGWDNDAYLVNDGWLFRFPRRAIAAPLLATEHAVLPRIAGGLPLAIPEPELIGEPAAGYPYPFSGYRVIPGTAACEANPSGPARHRDAAALGAFLRELHTTRLDDGLGDLLVPDLIGRTDLPARLPYLTDRLDRLADLGEDTRPARSIVPELARAPAFAGELRLVHGDLYSCHLLVGEGGGVAGVIDWGDMHRGDPALDISIAFSYLPPGSRGPLFAAYGDVTDADLARARFRAIHYGALLLVYGLDVGNESVIFAGRQALELAVV